MQTEDVLGRVLVAARNLDRPELLDTLADLRPATPRERLARLAVGALLARRAGMGADLGNLYAGAAGPAEMLAAFDAFVRDTPLVRFAHRTANAAHLSAIGDASAVRIVDVGIGSGAQWEPLLREIGSRPRPPAVTLVGIDLPAPKDPTSALDAVGARLTLVAVEAGVPFRFVARPGRVEDVELPSRRDGEVLTINAAFALHHTGTDRDGTLRRLAGTGADALVLCEPEADHDTPDFPERLGAALHHYGLVFEVLDRCLGERPDARAVIEGQFFGRELHNIVVGEGDGRVERHAPNAEWADRLARAGLWPRTVEPVSADALGLPRGVGLERVGPACAMTVDGLPLVVVSAWSARVAA